MSFNLNSFIEKEGETEMSKQMSEEYIQVEHVEVEEDTGMAGFYKSSHFWGRLTHLLAIGASFAAPLYLSFVVGVHPGWNAVIAGLIGYAAFTGVLWILEPVIFFPILGTAGTYMSFLAGNTANLNVPCSIAAQEAVGAKVGSAKAEVIGILGMATAIITNKIIIILAVLGGTYIVSILPDPILAIFSYVLPAIFASIFGQFSYKSPLYGGIGLVIAVLVIFSPMPDLIKIGASVAITITVLLFVDEKRKHVKNA